MHCSEFSDFMRLVLRLRKKRCARVKVLQVCNAVHYNANAVSCSWRTECNQKSPLEDLASIMARAEVEEVESDVVEVALHS